MTSRRHVFTWNNPDKEGQEYLDSLDTSCIKYIVFQLESGENGTPHFQGFVVWTSPVRIRQACARLGGAAHIERAMGSDEEASKYCQKEETRVEGPWFWGDCPHQGKRSDLIEIHAMVKAGAKRKEIIEEHFGSYLRYHKGIEIARLTYGARRDWEMEVHVFYGPTGTGKSRKAWSEAGQEAFVLMAPNSKNGPVWFDGYDGQKNVIIEEYYGWMRWNFLLQLLDRYPMRVPVKGGSLEWVPKKIWICSNERPQEWYNYNERMDYQTLRRRISTITRFVAPGPE